MNIEKFELWLISTPYLKSHTVMMQCQCQTRITAKHWISTLCQPSLEIQNNSVLSLQKCPCCLALTQNLHTVKKNYIKIFNYYFFPNEIALLYICLYKEGH